MVNKIKVLADLHNVIHPRIHTLCEVQKWVYYIYDQKSINRDALLCDLDPDTVRGILMDVINYLNNSIDIESWSRSELVSKYNMKLKYILQPVRIALTGETVSLPLFQLIVVLGKDECIRRLYNAINILDNDNV